MLICAAQPVQMGSPGPSFARRVGALSSFCFVAFDFGAMNGNACGPASEARVDIEHRAVRDNDDAIALHDDVERAHGIALGFAMRDYTFKFPLWAALPRLWLLSPSSWPWLSPPWRAAANSQG